MEALILTIFVSLSLVGAALLLLAWTLHQRSHEHGERLALLPLSEEQSQPARAQPQEPLPEPPQEQREVAAEERTDRTPCK